MNSSPQSSNLTGGGITAQTTGSRDAGDVVLQVGAMTTGPGADRVQISSSSIGTSTTGGAGSISIEGPGSTLDNQFPVPGAIALTATDVSTTSEGTGEGGSIALAAENGIFLVDSFVSGDVNNVASPDDMDSASIELLTSDLQVTRGGITAQTIGSRDAGDVVLKVGNITTQGGAEISSSSIGASTTGGAGSISIEGDGGFPTPGPIALTATEVSTTSEGTGESGSIALRSETSISLTDVTVSANVVNNPNGTSTDSSDIELTAPNLSITGGSITAQSTGSQDAGSIRLNAETLAANVHADGTPLANDTRTIISSSSNKTGKAGNISIQDFDSSTPLTTVMLNATDISTTSEDTGAGGNIDVRASDDITLIETTLAASVNNGEDPPELSPTSSITLNTPTTLTIEGGGVVAETTGTRKAGNLDFFFGDLITQAGSTEILVGDRTTDRVLISSSSFGTNTPSINQDGKAGNINFLGSFLTGFGTVTLQDTSVLTDAQNTADGGNIVMFTPGDVSLADSILSRNVKNLGSDQLQSRDIAIQIFSTSDLSITGGGLTALSSGSRNAGIIELTGANVSAKATETPLDVGGTPTTRVQLSSTSTGEFTAGNRDGNAGNVTIAAFDFASFTGSVALQDTDVLTNADNNGTGGAITVTALDAITLDHSTISSNVANLVSGDASDTPASISLTAPTMSITGGGITAQSTGSRNAGNVTLDPTILTTQEGTEDVVIGGESLSRVQISSSSTSTTPGAGNAGNILIANSFVPIESDFQPTSLSISNTDIRTEALGDGGGGTIKLGAREAIDLTESTISATVNNESPTNQELRASIDISTPNLTIVGGQITGETLGTRDAGRIFVGVDDLTIRKGLERVLISNSSTSLEPNSGDAGSILVLSGFPIRSLTQPQRISLNETDIRTVVLGDGRGAGLFLNALDSISLTESNLSVTVNDDGEPQMLPSAISLTTPTLEIEGGGLTAESTGSRDAGSILLNIDTLETVAGTTNVEISSSSQSTNAGSGNAGSILVSGSNTDVMDVTALAEFAHNISLNNTTLTTEVKGDGGGGDITLSVDETVSLVETTLSANVHDLDSADTSDPTQQGSASINIRRPQTLRIQGGGVTAQSTGTRNAGQVTFNVGAFETLPGSTRVEISSSSTSTNPDAGNAGNITIEGPNSPVPGPILLSGTDITTEAGTGQGGTILIDGAQKTTLDSTTVSARVTAGGEGGDITIHGSQMNTRNPNFGSEQLLIRNGSTINARSEGAGNAGTITLETAGTLRIVDSEATTEATLASGGNIKLDADFMIHILNSTIESSVAGDATTQGGNISIDPEFVIVQNSQIFAQANEGAGGNIDLIGDVVLIDAVSTIDASSAFGVSGTVNISSPIQNLSGAIAPLPETIIQTATLYGARCAAQKGSEFSSFNVRGRDRVPFEPGDYLLTPLGQEDNVGQNLLKRLFPSSPLIASRDGINSLRPQGLDLVVSFERKSTFFIFDGKCSS